MNGPGAVLGAGLLILALAGLIDLVAGTRRPLLRPVPYLAGTAGSVLLAVAGALAVSGVSVRLAGPGWLGAGTTGLLADRLSGLFLLITCGAATAISLAFASWVTRQNGAGRRGLGASYALAVGSVALICTATDAFTLLASWELLTIAFYLLAGFDRKRPGRSTGAFITLVFGRISGVALLVGLLLLAVRSGSLSLASFASVPAGTVRETAEVLMVGAFTIKVGLVPFQVWLPRGYAAAPGPARAIMAGVAVNVGFYGLWRTLALLGPPPSWLTGVLLVLAGLTALLGIAHAAVQPGLQRVVAYSSVENSGLILAGYGVALTGAAVHAPRLVAVGLLAATLQIIAHTAAKSLLFTSTAAIAPRGHGSVEAPGDDDLDTLRGVARRMPWSGTGLAIGSLTLAGLPLTAGFASEWFLLEALMQQFRVPGLGFRLVLAAVGAAVALTVGFAGVTFVRLIGLVALGPPTSGQSERQPPEYGPLGKLAIGILSAGCLLTAALLPLVIRVVAAGLAPVVPASVTAGARKSPWVVQPVFGGFSILSPSWLWLVMPTLLILVLIFARLVSGARLTRVRRVPAWRSATAGVQGEDCYTASGFANPARRVLATVLHTQATVRPIGGAAGPAIGAPSVATPAPGLSASAPGPATQTDLEPDETYPTRPRLGYTIDVVELVEDYLYRPLLGPVLATVRLARRAQSGRLDAYLAYMLIALIALIAVVTALA